MNIEATTLVEFENQYYKQSDNKSPLEVKVNLKTTDSFWKELTEKQINEAMHYVNFFSEEKAKGIIGQFSKVFLHPYGNITRV